MNTARLAVDPLWQCLCPAWTQPLYIGSRSSLARSKARPSLSCPAKATRRSPPRREIATAVAKSDTPEFQAVSSPGEAARPSRAPPPPPPPPQRIQRTQTQPAQLEDAFARQGTAYLYTHLRALAIDGQVRECRELVEYLIRDRRDKPNIQMYNALILSNLSHDQGGTWRVQEYLDEMARSGMQPDEMTCHAVLKVLAVHPDHLLQADVLEYMRTKWLSLTADGWHDVTAGMLRSAQFEQALGRMEAMRANGTRIEPWLMDMAVHMLCMANEVDEAYRIMRQRHDEGDVTLGRTLWYVLLDAGSSARHHASTALAWSTQVNAGYLNPASGICLNVLATAAQAGDAVLATETFTHLAKRGTAFTALHYQLLIDAYLAQPVPDAHRALTILSIMATTRPTTPGPAETRSLFLYLKQHEGLLPDLLAHLQHLHTAEARQVPIAALNLLIEAHVHHRDLKGAIKVYKLIHTFDRETQRSFANIETFNLLLRGCRTADPPDEGLASFLVSELLALQVKPTTLTYDRLILVFVEAGRHALQQAHDPTLDAAARTQHTQRGLELLDWAFRHFTDMQRVSATATATATAAARPGPGPAPTPPWMPRFGTLELLAVQLARARDERCWDVLQSAENEGRRGAVEAWASKGRWMRRNVEEAWARAQGTAAEEGDGGAG